MIVEEAIKVLSSAVHNPNHNWIVSGGLDEGLYILEQLKKFEKKKVSELTAADINQLSYLITRVTEECL